MTTLVIYDIIFNDSDFLKSFTFKERDVYEFKNKIYEEYKTKINDVNVSEILNYLSKNKNKEITKEFIYFLYESQNENKVLLLSFFFLQKKMKEKDFMEKLEKYYGACVDIDNIKKEMEEKLNEIKAYKQLFEYLGSEFGKNEDDIDIIKNTYEKAKKIGLLENNNKIILDINEIPNNNIERGRIRRGRGRDEVRGRIRNIRGRGRGRGKRG